MAPVAGGRSVRRVLKMQRDAGLVPDPDSVEARFRLGWGLWNQANNDKPTLADTLAWLARRYVISAHEQIAYSKLPEFTFRFPTCNSILRRVAEQAGDASNPVSRNGFGGRSKRQNIHGCRQENISCLQSDRQDHDHERYKRRDNERYRAKRRSERFRLEKSGRLAGSQNCEARADGKS